MTCRATFCGRAVASAVTALTGLPGEQVTRIAHALAEQPLPSPGLDDVLDRLAGEVAAAEGIAPFRRARLLSALHEAKASRQTPGVGAVAVWAVLLDEARTCAAARPPAQIFRDPDVAARWWGVLPPAQQTSAIRWHSPLVGSLDGLPPGARDAANRVLLAEDEAKAAGGLLDEGQSRVYRAVSAALRVPGRTRTLLLYDTAGNGRAAVGCGDITGADHLVVTVPGFRGRPARRAVSLVHDTDHVLDAADRWRMKAGTSAGVAWIGYRTPAFRELASLAPAAAGARALTRFVAGLGVRDVTVVGHSYGGVVAALAADASTRISRVVLAGAPGAPLLGGRRARDMFLATAKGDLLPGLQWFTGRPSPSARLQMFDLSVGSAEANHGHRHYFDSGSPAVAQMGAVVAGRRPPTVEVLPGFHSRPARALADLLHRLLAGAA